MLACYGKIELCNNYNRGVVMVETRETMQLSNKLYNAIKENNLQEVKECIIKAKSKGVIRIINFKDRNDKSPLERAVKNENLEIARFLIENGADINIQGLSSPSTYILCS